MVAYFKRKSGLTLIEVMLVIAVIAIILALILPAFESSRRKAEYPSKVLNSLGQPQSVRVGNPAWLATAKNWDQAYQTIRTNLVSAGFDSFGLYIIPDNGGFFVVTAPERIQPNGLPDVDRWNLARKVLPYGTVRDWFLQFASVATEGEYRIHVFAITAELPISTTNKPDWIYVSGLASESGDFAHLPADIRDLSVQEVRLHNYVYIFVRDKSERFPHPLEESTFSDDQNLKSDGLQNLFN
jgi:prepilin-type N-terminal cleavage/methylation domain-containing protein